MKFTLPLFIVLLTFVFTLQGCKTKEEKAASKALISAEQGAAMAQLKLARMYANGEGVPQDNVYAYMWVGFADEQGLGKSASEFKNKVMSQMTASQIAAGDKLAQNCKKNGYKDC